MTEVLNKLIGETRIECTDALRGVMASLNGEELLYPLRILLVFRPGRHLHSQPANTQSGGVVQRDAEHWRDTSEHTWPRGGLVAGTARGA